MNATRLVVASLAALLVGTAGCGGTSGNLPPRPIETLIYVTGSSGASFMFAETPDAACGDPGIPPTPGTGIQSPNASHQFGNRVFLVPHLFVLENIRQPVRAVIRNLDDALPIQVNVFLGTNQSVGGDQGLIGPGECRSISTDKTLPLVPKPSGKQTRVEVCSPQDCSAGPPCTPMLNTPCPESTNDRNIAYFATIGDIAVTNITNCVLSPILDACRSPSTFFVEQPKDQVDAIMSINPGQNPGPPLPDVKIRLELYIDDENVDNAIGPDSGNNPVVTGMF